MKISNEALAYEQIKGAYNIFEATNSEFKVYMVLTRVMIGSIEKGYVNLNNNIEEEVARKIAKKLIDETNLRFDLPDQRADFEDDLTEAVKKIYQDIIKEEHGWENQA